jgi:hypothetical protein
MYALSAKLPFNWRELTRCRCWRSTGRAWDNTVLPYKSVKEFIDAAKTATPPFKMGGTARSARTTC